MILLFIFGVIFMFQPFVLREAYFKHGVYQASWTGLSTKCFSNRNLLQQINFHEAVGIGNQKASICQNFLPHLSSIPRQLLHLASSLLCWGQHLRSVGRLEASPTEGYLDINRIYIDPVI